MDQVRKEWDVLKTELPAFQDKMAYVADGISPDQARNFDKWGTLGWHVSVGLVRFDTWEEEVAYVSDFFKDRVAWLDNYLTTL